MLIYEEWEMREQEASKSFEEEADEYHEHPEYEHWTIDRVAYEEEGMRSSESGDEEEDAGGRVIVQAFDDDLEKETARQLKETEKEAERSPLGEEGQQQEDNLGEDKLEGEAQAIKSLEIEQPREHMHEVEKTEEKKGKEMEKEESPWQQLSTKPPIKCLVFVQDSDEEGDAAKMKERAPRDKEIEVLAEKGEGGRESPKEKFSMLEWLERQLERKTPVLKDPRVRLEAILARAQITTRKEKKPKIRFKVTMDASGSRAV